MFPKFHGIDLANGGFIKNLNLEILAQDPANPAVGRVWFNSAQERIKYVVADSQSPGDVLVKSVGEHESITTELQSLLTTLTSVQQGLSQETTDRVSAVAAASAAASDQTATETAARQSRDGEITGLVSALQDEVNATQAGAGLGVDGAYAAPTGSFALDEATSLKHATELLDAGLAAAAAARTSAAASAAAAVAAEAQLRADGDAALQSQLTAFVEAALGSNEVADQAEAAARIAADTVLQAELDQTQAGIGLNTAGVYTAPADSAFLADTTTVMDAMGTLDTELARVDQAVTTESQARVQDVAALTAAHQAEAQARSDADQALHQELDATQASAGLEADGSYTAPTGSNYLAGATSLKDADYKLDAAIKVVADSVVAGGSTAAAAVAEIATKLDSDVATYKSTTPALTHTFNHGLNAEFLSINCMVSNGGTPVQYGNDYVRVVETDVNTITVTLVEAANIKLVVQRHSVFTASNPSGNQGGNVTVMFYDSFTSAGQESLLDHVSGSGQSYLMADGQDPGTTTMYVVGGVLRKPTYDELPNSSYGTSMFYIDVPQGTNSNFDVEVGFHVDTYGNAEFSVMNGTNFGNSDTLFTFSALSGISEFGADNSTFTAAAATMAVTADTDYAVKLTVRGTTVEAYLDDTLIVYGTFAVAPTLPLGFKFFQDGSGASHLHVKSINVVDRT